MSMFKDLPAQNFMSKSIISIAKEAPIEEARNILKKYNIHHLLVLEDNDYIGIISSNDILENVHHDLSLKKVSDIMNTDIYCIQRDTKLGDAAKLFVRYACNSLPVVDGNKVIGILTSKDVIKTLLEKEISS